MPEQSSTTSVADPVEYRDIAGFPGYRVGDDGSVWSRRSRWGLSAEWKRLKPTKNTRGYLQVALLRGKGTKPVTKRVHRLVLEAFVGPCPDGMEACHFPNVDKTDIRLSNLRWDTHKANIADSVACGANARGSRAGRAKLTEADVSEIRQLLKSAPINRIAKAYGLHPSTIALIAKGKNWAHFAPEEIEDRKQAAIFGSPKGSAHGLAKLTERDIPAIRRLLGSVPVRQIAALYGVTPGPIYALAAGRTWKHVLIETTTPENNR